MHRPIGVAHQAFVRFAARATRLYEQDRKEPSGPSRLGLYVRRWVGWVSQIEDLHRGRCYHGGRRSLGAALLSQVRRAYGNKAPLKQIAAPVMAGY